MNFFKKLLVSLKRPKTEDVEPARQPLEVQEPDIYDSMTEAEAANLAAREASAECLDRHWASVGTIERDVLAYMISPSFSGGPYWPSTPSGLPGSSP